MALTTVQLITQLYVGYYNRAPDPEGLNYWVGRVNAGVSLADIADSFAASPEAIATYPFLALPNVASAEGFLTQVYANLFGRAPDADGLAYYANKLATGATSPGQIIAEIQANANTNTTEGNTDAAFLANKVAVGEYWVNEAINTPDFQFNDAAKSSASSVLVGVTNNAATVDAAKAAADSFFATPNVPAVEFTTGIDAIVGTPGNDLFTATQDTLQATDSLDGGAGRDVLNYTATGAGHTIAAATIKNVEVVNVRNLSTAPGATGTKETSTITFNDVTVSAAGNDGSGPPPVYYTSESVTLSLGTRTVTLTGDSGAAGAPIVFTAQQIASAFATGASAVPGISVGGTAPAGYAVSGVSGDGRTVTWTSADVGDQPNLTAGTPTVDPGNNPGLPNTAVPATPTAVIVDGTESAGAGTATVTVNASNFVGATEFNSVNSAQDVVVNNVTAAQSVGLNGGTGALTYDTAATSSTINLTSIGNGRAVTQTGTSLETVTINSLGAGTNGVTLNLVGGAGLNGSVKALNINASTNLNAVLTAAGVGNDFVAAGADVKVSGIATSVTLQNGAFKSLDASGLTVGGVTASVSNVTESVKGGVGADVVTIGGGLKAGATVDLGAGNDRLIGTAALASTVGDIDGGEGRDAVDSRLINAGNGAKFKNFEILELGNTNLDLALLTGSTIDTLALAGVGGGTFSNVANTVKLEVSANSGGATIQVAGAAANAADVFDIGFVGKAGAGATAALPDGINAGVVTVANVETFNIASGGTGFVANELALTALNAKVITITGDKALELSFDGITGTNGAVAGSGGAVSLIDGSAATGKLTIDTTNVRADDNIGLTVKGGSADDKITIVQTATVDAGAGDDTIIVTATGITNGTSLTGGAGKDVFDVKAAAGVDAIVTITDFTVGEDKLTLSTQGTDAFNATKVNVDGATTLLAAIQAAAAGNGAVDSIVSWFQYAGDTYVVQDLTAGAYDATDDIVVKLAGLKDLSTLTDADFNFA